MTQVGDLSEGGAYLLPMARYFFDLHERDDVIVDETGVELALSDHAAVRTAAVAAARGIMADDILSGKLDLRIKIVILDQNRRVIDAVLFDEALSIIRD